VILFFVLYVFLTIAGTMLSMLQDRQRPVWPAAVAITPFVTLGVVYMFYPQHLLFDISMIYILLFCFYINTLRIEYFMHRYEEMKADGRPVIAQQLAHESGYRSYSTFSMAFKQHTGQSVTAWMHDR
jgi:AraC-like DNA-binding protein